MVNAKRHISHAKGCKVISDSWPQFGVKEVDCLEYIFLKVIKTTFHTPAIVVDVLSS